MDSDLSRPPATLPRPGEGKRERSKILVIGAKGMLGQALCAAFAKDNAVLPWDKEELDITDPKAISYQLKAVVPDVLINSAAYTDVDGAESNVELANTINGHAVGNIASVCKELDIPLVHFSTEYVFDGEKKAGYREDDIPNPISAYGRSKFLGEQELQKNTDKFYLIRLSRLFGETTPSPPPSPARGEGVNYRKKSFVELMLALAKTKTEIEVVDEEVSSPTYARDLAAATREIIEKKLPFGIYHRTNGGSCTWYEFAGEIFKITGKNVKINPVPASRFPRAAKRPKYAVLLNTKLPAMRDWKKALREFLISNS